MTNKSPDTIVLGAGIVGVSTALHLQQLGRKVLLIDRSEPGSQTSSGNAGVLANGAVMPLVTPEARLEAAGYIFNTNDSVRFHYAYLRHALPWLLRVLLAATPQRTAQISSALHALLRHAVDEHQTFLDAAGLEDRLTRRGWLKIHRTERGFQSARRERRILRRFDIDTQILTPRETLELEPHLAPDFYRAWWIKDTANLDDPAAVTRGYTDLFIKRGGIFRQSDVRSLRRAETGWMLETDRNKHEAKDVVIALGPWSVDLLRPLGLSLPLGFERGYHLNFDIHQNGALNRPLIDPEAGFALAPMCGGTRLTCGVEIAHRDAPPTPKQIYRVTARAKELLPLGTVRNETPWMGVRPSFPDNLPVVGAAPGLPGLWLNFGHGHLGLTLGPVTGRLVAQLITAQFPLTDPAPYDAARF